MMEKQCQRLDREPGYEEYQGVDAAGRKATHPPGRRHVNNLAVPGRVNALFLGLCGMLVTGCAAHVQGLIEPGRRGVDLVTMAGQRSRLVLTGDAVPMRYLDDHGVDVHGRRVLGRITVTDWKVTEGLHGMQVWTGTLERRGVQLGLDDRNSGAFYFLDEKTVDTLSSHVGQPVLVEGYVEGAHRVRVVYFRILADVEPAR
ncbi:MAG: hypothetical protein ACI9MC_002446 [Kiritimatiellia bacterium]|jgi:hypothetical protein